MFIADSSSIHKRHELCGHKTMAEILRVDRRAICSAVKGENNAMSGGWTNEPQVVCTICAIHPTHPPNGGTPRQKVELSDWTSHRYEYVSICGLVVI